MRISEYLIIFIVIWTSILTKLNLCLSLKQALILFSFKMSPYKESFWNIANQRIINLLRSEVNLILMHHENLCENNQFSIEGREIFLHARITVWVLKVFLLHWSFIFYYLDTSNIFLLHAYIQDISECLWISVYFVGLNKFKGFLSENYTMQPFDWIVFSVYRNARVILGCHDAVSAMHCGSPLWQISWTANELK